jgi:hypothetical protein
MNTSAIPLGIGNQPSHGPLHPWCWDWDPRCFWIEEKKRKKKKGKKENAHSQTQAKLLIASSCKAILVTNKNPRSRLSRTICLSYGVK